MERSLRKTIGYRGCLICYMLEKDESDFMAQFQYQTIQEERVRRDLVSSNGYCNFHFYQMSRLTSPIVNAVLTKDLIEIEIKEIEAGSFGETRRISCPACKYVGEQEDFYINEFKTLLREKSFQKEYEGTDGVCLVHCRRVLNSMDEGERNWW